MLGKVTRMLPDVTRRRQVRLGRAGGWWCGRLTLSIREHGRIIEQMFAIVKFAHDLKIAVTQPPTGSAGTGAAANPAGDGPARGPRSATATLAPTAEASDPHPGRWLSAYAVRYHRPPRSQLRRRHSLENIIGAHHERAASGGCQAADLRAQIRFCRQYRRLDCGLHRPAVRPRRLHGGWHHRGPAPRHYGGSSIAWTIGHVTTMVDSWINANFQGLPPHPFISGNRFHNGGTGECDEWEEVLSAAHEVRRKARTYLDSVPPIDNVIPYAGSIELLRETGLRLSYALMRIAAHHFIHGGEIVTIRSRLGHDTDSLSGPEGTGAGP